MAYNVTLADTAGQGFVTVAPGGATAVASSTVNWSGSGQQIANGLAVGVDGSRAVKVFAGGGGSTQVIIDVVGYFLPETVKADGGALTPITPVRAYDSRNSGAAGVLASGQSRVVALNPAAGIPDTATAVAYNVTVAGTTSGGFLTVAPGDAAAVTSSTLNWSTGGELISNGLVVGLDAQKRIKVFAGGGSGEHFIIDIVGYYTPANSTPAGGRFFPLDPVRAYDSRAGLPEPGLLASGGSRRVSMADGRDLTTGAVTAPGVLPAGAAAVVFNATVAATTGAGFLAVVPGDASSSPVSTLNWSAPDTVRANGSIVGVDADRYVHMLAGGGGVTHTILDVVGYYYPPLSTQLIAAGAYHTCAVVAGGQVKCWGRNDTGQLGDGTTTKQLSPVTVVGLSGVTALAAGWAHTCAVVAGGQVKCWGENFWRQLGDGTTTDRLTPVTVVGLSGVTALAVGSYHSCVVVAGGQVKCWGNNYYGELGDGTTTGRATPVPVVGLSGVTAVAAVYRHTCAAVTDGRMQCWGFNEYGQLGDGTTTSRSTPVTVAGLSGVTALAASAYHTCAVVAGGQVPCWGYNGDGELGDGTTTDRLAPVPVVGLSGVTSLVVGSLHSCAVVTGGQVQCWGFNDAGQLGDGTTTSRSAPVPVVGLSGAAALAAGDHHSCALVTGGQVQCWGWNSYGQLGDGTSMRRLTPVAVVGL